LGVSDGSVFIGLIFLIIVNFLIWYICYLLFKKGYKIKF